MYLHLELDLLPEKFNQEKGFMLLTKLPGCSHVYFEETFANKSQNIKSWQYSGFISFYSGILLGKEAPTKKNICHAKWRVNGSELIW